MRKTTSLKAVLTAMCAVGAALCASAVTHVDVLVSCDTTAAAWLADGESTLQAFAEGQVARANEVLANSGLSDAFDFRLVGVYQGEFTHDNSTHTLEYTLQYATGSDAAAWQALRAQRDACGADIVVVLVDSDRSYGMMGLSNTMMPQVSINGGEMVRYYGLDFNGVTQWLADYANKAYCVVDIVQASVGHVFTHEIGHIMGAGHSEIISPSYDEPGPQLFEYSSAMMAQGSDGEYYATIMGYNSTGYADSPVYNVLPLFSSPNTINPVTGDVMGDANHDNVRTLRNTYSYVAAFRQQVVADDEGGGDAGGGTVQPQPSAAYIPAEFTAKSTTLTAVVKSGNATVGLATFVVKATRKGVSKATGTFIGLDGKKGKTKSLKCEVFGYGDGVAYVTIGGAPVRGYDGALNVTLGSDGSVINGTLGGLTLKKAEIGVTGSSLGFWLTEPLVRILGSDVVQSVVVNGVEQPILPTSEAPEAVTAGAKWSVAKAGKLKMARDRSTGLSGLVLVGDGNYSGVKLSYKAKTGVFKGSFTAYAVVDGKLKKYKFKVTGVAVDGVGTGIAVCAKAGLAIGVKVGKPATR